MSWGPPEGPPHEFVAADTEGAGGTHALVDGAHGVSSASAMAGATNSHTNNNNATQRQGVTFPAGRNDRTGRHVPCSPTPS
jgi:hypothetical protein